MNKEQLSQLIREIMSGTVKEQLDEAIQPLLAQKTDWMAQIQQIQDGWRGKVTPERPKKGIGAARYLRAMAAAKGDAERAADYAKKAWNDDLGDEVRKALLAGDFTAGGALVPPDFSNEIIELLRARTVVRRAGPRTLPLNNGTMTIPRQTGASTASYVGESKDITKTQPTTGQLVLTAKKLAALVPISNDLLRYDAGNTADEFVRDDLVMQMAIREDQAFLRDDGTQSTPKGLYYWAVAANQLTVTGSWATTANIEKDLRRILNQLEGSNVPMVRPVWMMNPRVVNYLKIARDSSSGELLFPETRNTPPTLWGYPIYTTTTVPVNLGASSYNTEFYFVDMSEVVLGEASTIEIAVDSSASYVESGSLVSAFSRDETVMRAISRHDLAVRHNEAVAVYTNCNVGAAW